ncbi:MAG: hypothetical protein ACYST6_09495 [Planctomycetota bacterium]
MRDENLERMLSELGERAGERVRPDLAEEIKAHIPEHLHAHRRGLDTINIVIDLRVANIHGLYQDGKMVAKYLMGGPKQSDILTGKMRYELLVKNGEEVVLYSDIDTQDSNAVRMHWKVSQDKYKVVFADMREAEVSAEELIRLQARMLQERGK